MAVAADGRKSQPRRAGERDVEIVLSQSPVNLADLVTLGRLLMVVPLVWLIVAEHLLAAFWLFIAAGISDAVDGFIAKRFNARTSLGSYLDPSPTRFCWTASMSLWPWGSGCPCGWLSW